jgi:flagellar motility protein MotE (MotC chaperone)
MALQKAILAEARKCRFFVPQGDASASALATQVANEAERILRLGQSQSSLTPKEDFAGEVEAAIARFEEAEEREVPESLQNHLLHLIEMCRN